MIAFPSLVDSWPRRMHCRNDKRAGWYNLSWHLTIPRWTHDFWSHAASSLRRHCSPHTWAVLLISVDCWRHTRLYTSLHYYACVRRKNVLCVCVRLKQPFGSYIYASRLAEIGKAPQEPAGRWDDSWYNAYDRVCDCTSTCVSPSFMSFAQFKAPYTPWHGEQG